MTPSHQAHAQLDPSDDEPAIDESVAPSASIAPTMLRWSAKGAPAGPHLRRAPRAQGDDLESQLRLSIDSLLEGVLLIGYDWTFLYLNPRALEHVRQPANEVIGRRVTDCFPGIECTPAFRQLERAMHGRHPEALRQEFIFPDGHHGWFELRIEPVPCGVCVVSLDVTERHALETELRESQMRTTFALGAAHMGIWQLRLSTGAMYFSETIADLVGVHPSLGPDTIEGFLAWIDPGDRDAVRRAVDDVVTGRVAEFFVEFRVTRRNDGQLRWMAGQGRVVADEHGAPDLLLGVGIDVTDRREAERQLHQAQKMEAIGRLAGGIAHDFNNQLTAILGFCDMAMAKAGAGSQLSLDLFEIQRAAERSASLTKQLLAFSRQQVLTIEPLDLNDVVLRLVRMLERLLGEDLRCECHCGLTPVFIQGDAGQLEHVLTNLAINARDAMPTGGTLVIRTDVVDLPGGDLRLQAAAQPGRYGVLTVRDSGHGMDAATRARIFEPFFTTKSAPMGTGLGLSGVHGIVTQMNGFICVESAVGVGTTFRLYFPLIGHAGLVTATPAVPR